MGMYTQSIREILQYNKQPGEDVRKPEDILTISKRVFFTDSPINVINEEYRDRFITGFTLHFFNEELGYETLPLWKIALDEKIYNNGEMINLIYANLDKNVFADYAVKKINTNDKKENTTNVEGTTKVETSNTNKQKGTDTIDYEETETLGTTVTNKGSGTITNTKDGSDAIEDSGNVTNTKEGSDVVTDGGSITTKKEGSDIFTAGGSITTEKSGNDTIYDGGQLTNTREGEQDVENKGNSKTDNRSKTTNDVNGINIVFDTPQGSLSNMRSPGGDARETGISYVNGQTYNYMSAATERDETNVQNDTTHTETEDLSSSKTNSKDKNIELHELTNKTEYNSSVKETRETEDTTTYGSINTESRETSSTTTYGSSNIETLATKKEMSYNSSNIEERDTKDVTKTSGENSKISKNKNEKDFTTEDKGAADTKLLNETKFKGSESGTTDIIDYNLNYEMLYKADNYLNKVWAMFDDLFCLLF